MYNVSNASFFLFMDFDSKGADCMDFKELETFVSIVEKEAYPLPPQPWGSLSRQ